jgi:hypothetical protein
LTKINAQKYFLLNKLKKLSAVIFVCFFSAGSFDNGDNVLVFNLLGPQKSRPFIQSLHACTAVGFVLGTT